MTYPYISVMPEDPARPLAYRVPFRRVVVWFMAVWIGLWVVDSLKDWVAERLAGRETPLWFLLRTQHPWFIAWILLTPLAVYLACRYPPTRARWVRSVSLHALGAVVVALGQTALASLLIEGYYGPIRSPALYTRFVDFFTRFVMFNMMAYLGMVSVISAWTYYRGMRVREQEAMQLSLRSAALERAMSEARLEALRQQLHPHFLFNTLNTIASFARRGEGHRVTDMIERLGNLLRLRLDDGQPQEIPLGREIEWMDHYLAIERERFGDRLDIHTDVPRDVQTALVPAMLLQPLVENAVRHGIASADERGAVRVEARRDGECLRITVSDTGPGFGARPTPEGIGLSNTRERIAHLYGTDAALTVGNQHGGGGLVRVTLPWRTATPEDGRIA